MADYIERKKDKYIKLSQALEVLDSCACWWAHERMERIPSADVAEVRRGEWLPDFYAKDTRTGYEYLTLKCSVCGCGCMSRNNFCHRCGADMRKDGGT